MRNRLNRGEPTLISVGRKYVDTKDHLESVGLSCLVSTEDYMVMLDIIHYLFG